MEWGRPKFRRPKFSRPKFKNPVSGLKNKISQAKDAVASKAKEAKDKVTSTVSDHANSLKDRVSDHADSLKDKVGEAKDKLSEAKDKLDLKDRFDEAKDKLASKVSDHAEKLSSTIKEHAKHVSKAVSEHAKPLLAMGADAFMKCGAGAAMGNPAAVVSCIKTQAAELKAEARKVGDDVHDVVKSSYGTFTTGLAEDAATEISTMISLQNEFSAKVAEGKMTFKDALDGVVQNSVEEVIKEQMEIATQIKDIRTEMDTLVDEEIKR